MNIRFMLDTLLRRSLLLVCIIQTACNTRPLPTVSHTFQPTDPAIVKPQTRLQDTIAAPTQFSTSISPLSTLNSSLPVFLATETPYLTPTPASIFRSPVAITGTLDRLQVNPAFLALFQGDHQVNDGVLSIHIEETNRHCHRLDDPIRLRIQFRNLATKPITIQSYLSILDRKEGKDGNIFPIITTLDNDFVFDFKDIEVSSGFLMPSIPVEPLLLPGYSTYESDFDILLPKNIFIIMKNPISMMGKDYATLTPGNYHLRIIYGNFITNDAIIWQNDIMPAETTPPAKEDYWVGDTISNRIEVCVSH